jgi:uncharacterized protein YhaN
LHSEHEVVERTHDGDLFAVIARYLQILTDGRCVGLQMQGDKVNVELADGSQRSMSSLSGGLSDVTWIAARLAVLEFNKDQLAMPVIWDEPFARLDDQHLNRVQTAIEQCATRQQAILLTRDSRLSGWGSAVDLLEPAMAEGVVAQI